MKELKNKEIIIGLIVLIILCIIAISLIIKREFPKEDTKQEPTAVTEEQGQKETDALQSELDSQLSIVESKTDELNLAQEEVAAAKEKAEADAENEQQMQALALDAYADSQSEFHTAPVYKEYTGEEMEQLEELYYYWNDYQLDAVDDLIRLPRLRTAFTNELTGTNSFYYYGSLNSNGLPEGSGLAVYENNAYYCGEWKNGKRHGKGMWLQIYPDKPSTLNGVTGIIEHSYNGQWQNDYPNGEGQEHIGFDYEVMEGEVVITNVIGNFKDGYYNGELYIMTVNDEEESTDWEAVAKKGVFDYYHERYNGSGELPVWERMKQTEDDDDNYFWLDEPENVNWGIFGLKKMN